jgi:hypothetical protein
VILKLWPVSVSICALSASIFCFDKSAPNFPEKLIDFSLYFVRSFVYVTSAQGDFFGNEESNG